MKSKCIVALVPLRGGSKSIPKKNIKILAGKPLCAWVLEAAVQSDLFDKVVVSTDSKEISDVVKGLNLNIEVLMRPPELATDSATTDSVMLHVAELVPFETLITIQATSPFLVASDLINAYEKFEQQHFDSILTCVRIKRFFWTEDGKPINYDPSNRPMRQDFKGVLMENGAFYITRREILEKYKCRLGGKIGIYEMAEETAIEIDEPADWNSVEKILLMRKEK